MPAPFILALILLQPTGGAQSFAPASHAYISAFCAPITLQDADTGRLRQHYGDWGAHPTSDDEARAFRPQDADAPGQMVRFDDKDAPHIFVERRSGTCSLVYLQAHTPQSALDDLKTSALPINGDRSKPVSWRLIDTKRFGRPGPIRYFLSAGEDSSRFGLCATLFEDLRLNDATPATMVRVATCRLSGDETLDNG